MSITRQESVPPGMMQDPEGFRGTLLITTGKIPGAGWDAVPLRQLMDDRLLDALLERSRDEAGGCG
jgi:hypothetical protein